MSLYNQGYEEENEKTVGQSADINARGKKFGLWFKLQTAFKNCKQLVSRPSKQESICGILRFVYYMF